MLGVGCRVREEDGCDQPFTALPISDTCYPTPAIRHPTSVTTRTGLAIRMSLAMLTVRSPSMLV